MVLKCIKYGIYRWCYIRSAPQVLLQEGLLPQCAFISPSARPRVSSASGLSGPCMRPGSWEVGMGATPEESIFDRKGHHH